MTQGVDYISHVQNAGIVKYSKLYLGTGTFRIR
jgi:hypothetical protein